MKLILIIEDEVTICEVLVGLLEESYRTITASNGQSGLAMLAQHRPDLIICDVMMPILDGRAFCTAVRSNPEYEDIALIMMSAGATLKQSECDYQAFVPKPFDADELMEIVMHVIGP
jgi:two-component system alkaline phosphatase synthesis response regulator PhoP